MVVEYKDLILIYLPKLFSKQNIRLQGNIQKNIVYTLIMHLLRVYTLLFFALASTWNSKTWGAKHFGQDNIHLHKAAHRWYVLIHATVCPYYCSVTTTHRLAQLTLEIVHTN